MPLGNVSLNGSRPTRHLSGNCAGSRFFRSAMIGRRSASACASVTPGFSRPSRWTLRTPSTISPALEGDRQVDVGAAPHEALRHDADHRAHRCRSDAAGGRARSGRRRTAAARTDSRARRPAPRPARRPRRVGVRPMQRRHAHDVEGVERAVIAAQPLRIAVAGPQHVADRRGDHAVEDACCARRSRGTDRPSSRSGSRAASAFDTRTLIRRSTSL